MLSKSHKNFLEAARLGLRGEIDNLKNFLITLSVDEINKNHHEVSNSIMELLKAEGVIRMSPSNVTSSPVGGNTVSPYNMANYLMDEVVWLAPDVEKRVHKLLEYLRRTNGSANKNLKRLLLYGPPGTGKTTLGFYVAKELGLPVRYVRVTDLLSSRLGETMKNISDVFQATGKEVIFIDEFDAFAKTRMENSNDVGELKRIVNSIIQTLDFISPDKIVIVATNLIDSIDPAILRRFPFKVEVGKLSEVEKEHFFFHLMEHNKFKLAVKLTDVQRKFLLNIFNLLELDTVDELRSLAEKTEIEMTLASRTTVEYKDFVEVLFSDGYLSHIKQVKKKDEKLLSKFLQEIEKLGYPKTQISSMLKIHRNTYPKYRGS